MLRRNFLKLGAVLPFLGLTSLAKSDTITTEEKISRFFPIDDQYYWKVSGPAQYVYRVEQNQLSKNLSYHIDDVHFVHIRQNTFSKDVYLHLAMCSQPPNEAVYNATDASVDGLETSHTEFVASLADTDAWLFLNGSDPESKKDYLLGWYFYQENQLSDMNDKITITLSKLA